MTKMTKKSTTITTIRRARNKNNPNVPGNIIINPTGDPVQDAKRWFSGREWTNNIVGGELPREIPITAFIGARITYDVLSVTQEMLDAGIVDGVPQHKELIGGREIIYRTVSEHNVNLAIDWSTMNFTDSTVNMTKIKAMFRAPTQAPTLPAKVAPASLVEQLIEEPVEVVIPDAVIEVDLAQ